MHPCIAGAGELDKYSRLSMKQGASVPQSEDRENKRCIFLNNVVSEIESPRTKRNRKNISKDMQQPGMDPRSDFNICYNVQEYQNCFITQLQLPSNEDPSRLHFQFLDDSRQVIISGRSFRLPVFINHPAAVISCTTYRVVGPKMDLVELFTPKFANCDIPSNQPSYWKGNLLEEYASTSRGQGSLPPFPSAYSSCELGDYPRREGKVDSRYWKVPFALESRRFKRIVTSRYRRKRY